MSSYTIEPGSFRDRHSRVYYRNGEVLRGLSAGAVEDWRALTSTSFFPRLMAAGKIVKSETVTGAAGEVAAGHGEWAGFLRHETIPFVSYPYEWSFGMLRDAAVLQLELLGAALAEKMVLKDSTPYNVQWRGVQPTFIDIPSFTRMSPGEPWVGYRQFCEMFLYPLLLQAYKGVAFHPWMRGQIDGITPEQLNQLMSWRDLWRPGVFMHVYLHSKMQASYQGQQRSVREDLDRAGFHHELIQQNVRRLKKLVDGLSWRQATSTWSSYARCNSYTDEDARQKAEFVTSAAQGRHWKLVWDLGSNTGAYSRIAAKHSDYVVAMDSDHLAVEMMYRSLAADGVRNVLPLVVNIADSSPGLGWRGLERKPLVARGRPELVLALALIHHLVITANIPLKEVVDWLASLGSALVIEFVDKNDPMTKRLLQNKEDIYWDYEQGMFEKYLSEHFTLEARKPLASGTRTLYLAVPGDPTASSAGAAR